MKTNRKYSTITAVGLAGFALLALSACSNPEPVTPVTSPPTASAIPSESAPVTTPSESTSTTGSESANPSSPASPSAIQPVPAPIMVDLDSIGAGNPQLPDPILAPVGVPIVFFTATPDKWKLDDATPAGILELHQGGPANPDGTTNSSAAAATGGNSSAAPSGTASSSAPSDTASTASNSDLVLNPGVIGVAPGKVVLTVSNPDKGITGVKINIEITAAQ